MYKQKVFNIGNFFVAVVSTITCPRTGSAHKVARRLMNFKGIDFFFPFISSFLFLFQTGGNNHNIIKTDLHWLT